MRAVAPPYPGAFTMLGGQRLRLLRTRLMGRSAQGRTPQLRFDGQHLIAECADGGVLRIVECDVDGVPLAVEKFAEHFGGEPVALGELE